MSGARTMGWRKAGMLALMLGLAACGEAAPGLDDEARVEKVVSCKDALSSFAPAGRKRDQLCECTTAKLAAQNLTIADLAGAKRDRAMEQLRWCMAQVGLGPKPQTALPDEPEVVIEEPAVAETPEAAMPDAAEATPAVE